MGIRKEVKVVADILLIRKTIEMLTSCGQQQHGADYISHNPQRGLKGECSIKNTQAFVRTFMIFLIGNILGTVEKCSHLKYHLHFSGIW